MTKNLFNADDLMLSNEEPYLRPFICKEDYNKAKISLIGINPASPIFPKDIEIEEYIELCKNYEKFISFYKMQRKQVGKTEISRTRMGIQSFEEWIEKTFKFSVVETDVFTYPTSNISKLKYINKDVLSQSVELFWKSFQRFSSCEIAIIYGTMALKKFLDILINKNIPYKLFDGVQKNIGGIKEVAGCPIQILERNSPVLEIVVNGRKVTLFAIRHLMYYGKDGTSFNDFKIKLKNHIEIRGGSE